MVEGHVCDSPVSVIIHDASSTSLDLPSEILGEQIDGKNVGIPVFGDGVTVHERKDGPMSISRRAQIEFPLKAFGTEWFKYIEAFNAGGEMQRATVAMDVYQLPDSSISVEEVPNSEREVITGYVGAVGADGTNAGNITIFGPYNLLSSIPVGVRIDPGDGGLRSVMRWFAHRFEQGQNAFEDVGYDIVGIDNYVKPSLGDMGSKTFSANRDTMEDVADWIQEEFSMRMWFEPDPDTSGGIIIRLEFLPEIRETLFEYNTFEDIDGEVDLAASQTYDATTDGDVDIIYNNALYEMKPYNTLILRGTELSEPPDPREIALDTGMVGASPRPTGRYPEAKAHFPELVERAGGEMPVVRDVDLSSQGEMENAARKQLKNALDTVSGGTMDLLLSPMISPHDKIIAQPACAGVLDTELPKLTYEVQRTAHKVRPNSDDGEVYQTEVSVSMAVPAQEIEVETTLKDTQPSAESDNEPGSVGEQFDAISYTS